MKNKLIAFLVVALFFNCSFLAVSATGYPRILSSEAFEVQLGRMPGGYLYSEEEDLAELMLYTYVYSLLKSGVKIPYASVVQNVTQATFMDDVGRFATQMYMTTGSQFQDKRNDDVVVKIYEKISTGKGISGLKPLKLRQYLEHSKYDFDNEGFKVKIKDLHRRLPGKPSGFTFRFIPVGYQREFLFKMSPEQAEEAIERAGWVKDFFIDFTVLDVKSLKSLKGSYATQVDHVIDITVQIDSILTPPYSSELATTLRESGIK